MHKNQRVCAVGVALLAEGVDRNYEALQIGSRADVALLAEGVDRNICTRSEYFYDKSSPSSRRAWIEINVTSEISSPVRSPSSRRAWIEMF